MQAAERKNQESASARVLVVDDEPSLRLVLEQTLSRRGYGVTVAGDVAEALRILEAGGFDLVISDVLMPGATGIDLLREVRRRDPEIAFILITGAGSPADIAGALDHEADAFLKKPFDLEMVRFAAERALRACDDRRQLRALRDAAGDAETDAGSGIDLASVLSTVSSLTDLHDGSGERHAVAAGRLAREVGRHLGLARSELEDLTMAAHLYDVGKIGVPGHILEKRGGLSPEELQAIRLHPVIGAEIVARSDTFSSAVPAVRHHHERWDGLGYPDGLEGDEIPLFARILAVVDAYLAITSDRAYRPRSAGKEAVAELRAQAGRQFDPRVVDAFCRLMEGRARTLDHV